MKDLLKRSSVKKEDPWDLNVIFETKEKWKNALKEVNKRFVEIDKYVGKLDKIETIKECFNLIDDIDDSLDLIAVYASYFSVTDMGNSEGQMMETEVMNAGSDFSQKTAFIVPELTTLSEEFLNECLGDERLSLYKMDFKGILRSKQYVLSDKEEKLLARAGVLWGDIDDVFSKLEDVDMKFKPVKDSKGIEHMVSHGTYSVHLESYDRELRKNAFESMYTSIKDHIHTFATTLQGKVKQHHFHSEIRGYKNTLHAALHGKGIDESVYMNLIL